MKIPKVGVLVITALVLGFIMVAGCGGNKSSGSNASSTSGNSGTQLETIAVSHQPCLHALPTYMAMQKGWDKEAGLKIDFQFYPSGPPQNEALASNKWEVGAEGAVPAMLAAIRYGAYIIAISNDESETNDLWVRPDSPILKVKGYNPKYPEIYGSPDTLKGKTILLTTASTGHYAVIATLRALGLDEKDVKLVHMEQSQAMAAFEAGQGDVVQLWAPYDYIAQSKGWVKISSGLRAGVKIPGVVLASKKAFEENPEKVAKWLKLYMKGIQEMKSNPTESAKILDAYYKEHGLTLDQKALSQEFTLRPLFNTKEQLALFSKKDGGTSEVENWMAGLADFFVAQGRITEAEKDKFLKGGYITDKILKLVANEENKK
ncbi:ABC transporter substrate-binding protein [Moorella naiadis]|uniref:ABC transporter substrate-binding protein n=1 Tax=Moorella naiadis (nom. illeg.) TaxID=3093670 RepID=UPI003D9C93AF